MKILVICTGNTCRSQMAEGFLRSFDRGLDIQSAGTHAEEKVNPNAVKVMKEAGIDISDHRPKSVDLFLNDTFDYVITVCNEANEVCPYFSGDVKKRLHIGFEDPADAKGNEEEVLAVYRNVRDQIKEAFYEFYQLNIK
jgi:arsenate reductase